MTMELAYADITKESTEAIVNAANSGLWTGSGVCGAIHAAGGPSIEAECKAIEGTYVHRFSGEELNLEEAEKLEPILDDDGDEIRQVDTVRCPTGEARVTGAGELECQYVIHAVGPIYHDGESGEAEELYNAYFNSLLRAGDLGLDSVSFPSLSTGIFGYPLEEAAPIAKQAIEEGMQASGVKLVRICVIDEQAYQAFKEAGFTPVDE